jgi:Tfp pilus assembly protein PilE
MRVTAWVMVLATMSIASCKKDGASDDKAAVAPSVTSPAIDALIANVPGNASAIAFVDLNVAPWSYVTGGAGFLLDPATQKELDKDLRAYVDRFVGVDVSKLQYAVAFVAGPPMSGAVLLKTVAGTPKIPGAADYEGAKVWRVPGEGISVALKGDTVVVGQDDAVRGVLDTMAQKRKSVVVENKPLVDWLHAETKGAAVALAAIAPKDLPLPPQIAGLSRIAVSVGRTRVRAVVDGTDAAIASLQGLIDQQIALGLEQAEHGKQEAIAGNIPPPAGAIAIISAAYAKSFVAAVKPKREGNRLVSTFDLMGQGTEGMMIVSTIGILAAVAIPAFMDYMKKSKKTEASLQLNKLGKNLKVFYITESRFPAGEAALTPSTNCCQGPAGKCESTRAMWQQPVWQALDFEIADPHRFKYSYRSDGTTVVAEAVGDLDCDGQTITYRLEASAPNGDPTITIIEPAPNTD